MKNWNKPEFMELGAEYTEAGTNGVASDGVFLEGTMGTHHIIVVGTSGANNSGGGLTPVPQKP